MDISSYERAWEEATAAEAESVSGIARRLAERIRSRRVKQVSVSAEYREVFAPNGQILYVDPRCEHCRNLGKG